MGIVQHQQDRALAESVGLIHVPLHLSAADILGPMSTSYVTAVRAKGTGKIIIPEGPIATIYTPGSVAFGGTPALQVGYPNQLTYCAAFNGFPLDQLTAKGNYLGYLNGSANAYPDLSDFENQPLVVSFADATAALGEPQGNGSIDLSFYYRVLSLY